MTPLLKRELKVNLKSLIIWTLSIGLLLFVTIATFSQMEDSVKQMNDIVKSLPEAMVKAFGMDKMDITTIEGFYGTKGYIMITLFGSIYGIILGSNILAKEKDEKTIEVLLSKPIERKYIAKEKIKALILNILIFSIVNFILVYLGFIIFSKSKVNLKLVLWFGFAPFLLNLMFASIAVLLSTLVKKGRGAFGISFGIIILAYFFNILSAISKNLEWLGNISPFKYVDGAVIITNGGMEVKNIIIMLVIIVVTLMSTVIIYDKKDF